VDRLWGLAADAAVGTDGVVVEDEAIKSSLQLLLGGEPVLGGEEPLLALVESLDFPARLGVVGPGMLRGYPEREQFLFERAGESVALLRGEDQAVVGEERRGIPPRLGG
jgi:hypothetical protein